MQRYLIILVILLLGIGMPCPAETLSLETMTFVNGSPQEPIEDIEFGKDKITVSYVFSGIELVEDDIFTGRHFIKIPGFHDNMMPEDYAYPRKVELFMFPKDAKVSLTIDKYEYVDIPLLLTYARIDRFENQDPSEAIPKVFPADDKGFYPSQPVVIESDETWGDIEVRGVEICPVLFNPLNQYIRVITNLEFTLRSSVSMDYSQLQKEYFRDRMLNLWVNFPDDIGNLTPSSSSQDTLYPRQNESILILSVDKYKKAVDLLADWKRTCGYNVITSLKSSWTTATITSEITSIRRKNPDLKYIILLGDNDDLPGMQSKVPGESHITDYYYGIVNNKSKKPNIYRGRISVMTPDQALKTVYKIISTEKNPVKEKSFYDNYIHAAYYQTTPEDPTHEDAEYITISEKLRDYLKGIGKNVERIYRSDSPLTPFTLHSNDTLPDELMPENFNWAQGSQDVINAINKGKGLVFHRDHGWVGGWMAPKFETRHVLYLENKRRYPIIFNINCESGNFKEDSFAEHLLKFPNGGGAGIIAATNSSKTTSNNKLSIGMYHSIWPEPGIAEKKKGLYIPEKSNRLADIMEEGLTYMGQFNRNSELFQREIYHVFGDPTMIFYKQAPDSINTEIEMGDETLSIVLDKNADITAMNLADKTVRRSFNSTGYSLSRNNDWSVLISGNNVRPVFIQYSPSLDIYIQNEEINSDRFYWGKTVTFGYDVTEEIPQGTVEINAGNLYVEADEVEFCAGFEINQGATMEIIQVGKK